MPLLDAALAFALTMLALSTLVSMVAGMLTWTVGLRRRGLEHLLTAFFEREVAAALGTEAARLTAETAGAPSTDDDETPAALLESQTQSLVDAGESLRARVRTEGLDHLDTAELRRALLDTDAGRSLRLGLGEQLDSVLDALGERWEDLGRRSSRRYRRWMRWWTTVLGALLAFALNIDSSHLAATYLSSPMAREAAIAELGSTLERARTVVPAAPADPRAPTLVDRASLDDEIRVAREQLIWMRSAGLPIGFSYFPYCADGESSSLRDARCAGSRASGHLVLWIFGCLATALLAGLGAPFWYDLVLGLASTVERVRRAPDDDETEVGRGRTGTTGGRAS
ncbi:MAG: hypothetical protein AAGC60_02160 [Acidobacteriota bacterium]